jgi:hypothetical protein
VFAGAAREVVFSNPEVVRRVNELFIPVALKAGMVNNPPPGMEGRLYAEISRSKPAPQGICAANSDGKVLAWTLSFDDEASIVKFLDYAMDRYRQSPSAETPVTTERYMKFPGHRLSDVPDRRLDVQTPDDHGDERCLAEPMTEQGTLLGTIVGRALDAHGNPVADTVRQEHYMEARLEISPAAQRELAMSARLARNTRFTLPEALARALVGGAYLGQLDVNPMHGIFGAERLPRWWEFHGQQVDSPDAGTTRIRITGNSNVEGRESPQGRSTDGREWEHRVTLDWYGFIDIRNEGVTNLTILATGEERLRWNNPRLAMANESDAEHLMAGHPIDMQCGVLYGLIAQIEK